ncbi:hypothetical protein [Listeria fleischmannii]|uniref:hypothetical protein n=1 Tax=Listeria fleischmannii TaxID=1069827 RepID=UPI0016287F78|nr:hypothetical protein [Listeria fleischmannii]MBC1417906.1 hypothetical protein [Listeria fleischmannii]
MNNVIQSKVNDSLIGASFYLQGQKDKMINKIDKMLVSYDAWFLVLLAVIMTLALVIGTGLAIWCLVYKGKKFTGNWKWSTKAVSISVQCK